MVRFGVKLQPLLELEASLQSVTLLQSIQNASK